MNPASLLLFKLCFVLLPAGITARNVIMQPNSDIAVAALGNGLLLRQGDQVTSVPLPAGLSGFHDVSIDVENDSLVFALDVASPRVCSYTLGSATASLVLNNCVGSSFSTSPFCGVSARGGTLVISGGTGGVTIFDYDTSSGKLQESPRVLNRNDLNVVGFPDVLMISSTQAAMSTDIGGAPRFGTVVVSIQDTTLTRVGEFRMEDSLGFSLALGPANFPFVNAIYDAGSNGSYMFTANGGMTVQNPLENDSSVVIDPIDTDFRAVKVAVNQEMGLVLFGGLIGNQSVIYIYRIVDQTTVTPVEQIEVDGRITGVASSGSLVAYVISQGSSVGIITSSAFQPEGQTTPPTAEAPSPTTPAAGMGSSSTSSSSSAIWSWPLIWSSVLRLMIALGGAPIFI